MPTPTRYPHTLSLTERLRRDDESRCYHCAAEFERTSPGRRYCSDSCRSAYRRARQAAAGAIHRCAFEDLTDEFGECLSPEDAAFDPVTRQYVCVEHEGATADDDEAEEVFAQHCLQCSGLLPADARSDARYCSPRCRQAAYRGRAKAAARGPVPDIDPVARREFYTVEQALEYAQRYGLPESFIRRVTTYSGERFTVPTAAADPDSFTARHRLRERELLS